MILQPSSTVNAQNWSSTAATLHQAVNEGSPSDASYISANAFAVSPACEMGLPTHATQASSVTVSCRLAVQTRLADNGIRMVVKIGSDTIQLDFVATGEDSYSTQTAVISGSDLTKWNSNSTRTFTITAIPVTQSPGAVFKVSWIAFDAPGASSVKRGKGAKFL